METQPCLSTQPRGIRSFDSHEENQGLTSVDFRIVRKRRYTFTKKHVGRSAPKDSFANAFFRITWQIEENGYSTIFNRVLQISIYENYWKDD